MDNKLTQYIRDQISGASSCRIDCPICGGNNTFSISKVDGFIVYYCFRASCNIRGKLNDVLSIDDIRNISSNSFGMQQSSLGRAQLRHKSENVYNIPEHFISPLQNTRSFNVLKRYNLIDFYSKQPETIRYDPKLNRLVFILKDHEGVIKGATGRSLSFSNIPRWLVYERIAGCTFSVYNSTSKLSKVVLVEDCISASVLASMVSSIGLLGTNVSDDTIQYLLPYDKLFIALDDDATGKAIKLQKRLNLYRPTEIIPLKKDIKYFTIEELETLKRSIENAPTKEA